MARTLTLGIGAYDRTIPLADGTVSPDGIELQVTHMNPGELFRLQARGVALPYPVFLMFPYAITLAVLAFAAGGGRAPGDLGRPYTRKAREGG